MFRSLRTRLFAAVLVLPLVALATTTSGVSFRCRITGVILPACCCAEGDAESAKAEFVATISSPGCCDLVFRNLTPAPAELSAKSQALSAQPTLVAIRAIEGTAEDPVSSSFASRAQAKDRIGPPTVRLRLVTKSAFLI